ncbi:MAG TPA: hypothetical protein VJ508_05265, partial [Saprospiraceae bacterium]|nr:hypothetical protein [Saprospiraceae bacterium]
MNDVNTCCDDAPVQLMTCDSVGCNIYDLQAEPGDCNSDSTYLLDLVFNHYNLPNDSITVTANGQFIGQYLVDPQFNRIEHFPELGSDTIHLLVCAVGSPDCCDDVTYLAPDCSLFGHCRIWNLQAFIGECNSDSSYVLHLEFNHTNLPGDSVHISANGNVIGDYAVNNGNIFIENFPAYDSTTSVSVCALGDTSCCDAIEYTSPDCSDFGHCHISNLVEVTGDCNSDSTFWLHMEFDYANLPVDSVIVTGNGNVFGTFALDDGHLHLYGFPIYGTDSTLVTICAVGDSACCAEILFDTPDCPASGTCAIYELEADPGDCTSDTTYNLFIHYLTNYLPVDSVDIHLNDVDLGVFAHNPDGILLTNVRPFNTDYTVVTVCAAGST